MRPIAIVDSELQIVKEFDDTRLARQALAGLDPGTYHIVRFIETGIEIEAPPPVTTNVVKRGTGFIHRGEAKE